MVLLDNSGIVNIFHVHESFFLLSRTHMDLSPSNTFCKEAAITSGMLLGHETFPNYLTLKKGLILELLHIKKVYDKFVSWPIYYSWIKQMCVDPGSFSINALRKSVLSIEAQYKKLKKKPANVKKFTHEVYRLPQRVKPPALPEERNLEFIAVEKVVPEITSLKKEIIKKDAIIKKLKLKFNTRNINKLIKRREEKITKLLLTIKSYKHSQCAYQVKRIKSLTDRLRYYKAKCSNLESKQDDCSNCDILEAKVNDLKCKNAELQETNAELIDECNKHIKFYKENKYIDNLRLCIMELLSYNIGILKIEPVLKSVFKLLNVTYDKLPKRSTITEILIESDHSLIYN